MCIPYVVWKEHKLYIISLIYLTAVIKLLGRKFLMFGQTLISKLGKNNNIFKTYYIPFNHLFQKALWSVMDL